MISVVMATYNGEKYIREQLDTIWFQTVKPDEIIVSDDASTDKTLELVRRFKEETNAPVKILADDKQKGYVLNFITGLKEAQGDYVFLSDQDDIWLENRIESAINTFEENANVDVLSCRFQLVDGEGKPIGKKRFSMKRNRVKEGSNLKNIDFCTFIRHPKYPGMAMAMRKHVVDEMLKRDDKISAHDWQLNLVAVQKNAMYISDEVLVQYRQHDGNTVGTIRTGKQVDSLRKRIKLLKVMRDELFTIKPRDIAEKKFISGMIVTLSTRIKLMEKKKIFGAMLYGMRHLRYVSLTSVMGDVYTIMKAM